MNLRALETLIAIAEVGSFAAAADRVGVTQSAVSMQMKALEEDLAVALFDRSRRPPILNETGRRILDSAREMVRLGEALKATAAGERVRGRLRLGVIPTAATGLVPDALAGLARRAPELQIRIESGLSVDLVRRVAQGGLDAAVVTETPRLERGLVIRTILEEALVVVAPATLVKGAVTRDGDTARHLLRTRPFVRFNRRTGVGRVIEAALRQQRITVNEAMELDSIEAILAMVTRGLGVAVSPAGSVQGSLALGLEVLPFGDPQVHRKVGLIERERRDPDRVSVLLFRELMAQAAKPILGDY
ncbi:MAG: LysR family transcriptional regulator [Alphaproteobacteria bacterium]|nr:LysR family transcriptional regulator [Alphaproteobacteria bacterium]